MEKQAMCSAVGESLMRSVQESKKELAVQAETTFKKEQIGEHRINYDHYRVLQEVDGKEQLRIVPKLTAEHVCPDNMRKMSVKLAVQIIQDFMIILDLTERNHVEKGTAMFASQVTMESLRVTLSSILELTNDLLAKGARYVLTGKLIKTPWRGSSESPGALEVTKTIRTILSFSHIYRLLSLYTPVKASIAGNVQEEPTLILATVQETMKQGKKQQLATYEKLRETISAKISERLTAHLHTVKRPPYVVNLDPACSRVPYPANVDIRDTVKYKEVMKQYGLGPNGAIVTSLNLFSTRFYQVVQLIHKRKSELEYVIFDTPGQIEVFTWSASGNIITETLASEFPTVVVYVMDMVRSTNPVTFMSNMLYACSILYRTKLPFIIAMNKVDVVDHQFAVQWMQDFEVFQDALQGETSHVSNLSRSLSYVLDEFYANLNAVGVSAVTGKGVLEFIEALQKARHEYDTVYRPEYEQLKKKKEDASLADQRKQLERLKLDVAEGDSVPLMVGCVARDEPEQRQTGDSEPKRRTQAIQVPARERGCPRYCRPTTSWGGIAGMSTASRGAAWPAVLFLAEGIADLGEGSPRAAVQHSDERGLANGHGCVEHRVSAHALRWTGWPFPAWSIASPMRVDCSVVAPMLSSAGVTRASHFGKGRARCFAGRDAGVCTEDHGAGRGFRVAEDSDARGVAG
ncbi:hypothetical protein HPB51_021279 [Rhipicephalus microplus]|uniref:GPN-loop GTPase 1 n=1 Tax=Rhipicephalus microplus TaxID=6941 RepID=A0A9J6F674_RHIMP|nr:hypothetical protein HPB51_021279 [Rhipicephalus microplus]